MLVNTPIYDLSRSGNKEFERVNFRNFNADVLSTLIWLIFPTMILVLVPILKTNVEISEHWVQTFGRTYASSVSIFTKFFPFSLTEIFFIFLAVLIIAGIVKLIRLLIKKQWISGIKHGLSILVVIASILATYNLSCEFCYTRKPLELPYYTTQVDNSEFRDIFNYYAEDINECIASLRFKDDGDIDVPYNIYGLCEEVNRAYKILDGNNYLYSHANITKPMMTSLVYRELQITGMTFNPFNEANIDVLTTNLEMPMTIAHELAHTKGVMREDDANQVAFYVCLNSDNPYLRFSAYGIYFYQIGALSGTSYMSEEDQQLLLPIANEYFTSKNYAYNYWKKHDFIGKIGDWLNNLYIKSSGVDSGTESYEGGTEFHPEPDPVEPEIIKLYASKYQQLFFDKYFRNKGAK